MNEIRNHILCALELARMANESALVAALEAALEKAGPRGDSAQVG